MSGKSKRTVRTIFAVIFIIVGLVFGVMGGGCLLYKQSLVSQKAEVEEDETSLVIQVDNKIMSREEYFRYVDDEIKEWDELTPAMIGVTSVGVIFILLAVNNIRKNKKEKKAEQITA